MMDTIIIERINVIGKLPEEVHLEIAGDVKKLVTAHNRVVETGDTVEAANTFNRFVGFVNGVLYAHVVVKWRFDDTGILN